ncbi:hypothetical protein BKI52_27625 [marine bacterium AO1-C]|nr:hypothetical protein BKI52_27625 [marine bacterium AO1-C]
MKLIDSILLSASVGLFIIGINQLFADKEFYWIFMLSLICLFAYQIRKLQRKEKATEAKTQVKSATTAPKQKKNFTNTNRTKKKKRRK